MEFDIIKSLTNEYTQECDSTRKLLQSIPMEKGDWKPHVKSMSLHDLAVHVADIPNWVPISVDQDELDFSKSPYVPRKAANTEELLKIHDDAVRAALASIANTNADVLKNQTWTMRNGEQIYFTMPKIAVVRSWCFNHLYHHRGQLTVYLRLLDIPVPGMYGPTADDK